MGIDVMLTVHGDLTLELNAPFIHETTPIEGGALDVENMFRYYGPSYRRGPWPAIYALIREVQAMFPKATLYYGDDHAEEGSWGHECTAIFLEEQWLVWLTHADDE